MKEIQRQDQWKKKFFEKYIAVSGCTFFDTRYKTVSFNKEKIALHKEEYVYFSFWDVWRISLVGLLVQALIPYPVGGPPLFSALHPIQVFLR